MAFITAAIVGGAIAAGGGLASAAIGSHAAGEAADKQQAAANYATDMQKQMFDQQFNAQQPWRQAGQAALGQMGDPYFQKNFSMADYQADPGYQFRLQQGMDAIQRSAAAGGSLMNTGTMKALNDYAQGSASQEYQNAYNRFTNDQSNRFNRLASLAGIGQTANSQIGQAGMNAANNMGNIAMGNANAQGAAGIAQANAWGGALGNIGNSAQNWMMMSKLSSGGGGLGSLGGGGGGGSSSPDWFNAPSTTINPNAAVGDWAAL